MEDIEIAEKHVATERLEVLLAEYTAGSARRRRAYVEQNLCLEYEDFCRLDPRQALAEVIVFETMRTRRLH